MTGGGRSLAFVVQRYGADVAGGSESLARALAERLSPEFQVTVFTTCARDYVTWRNELPPGSERAGGVEVLRFPVEEERDLDSFNAFSEPLYRAPHSRDDELLWLRQQGPYVPRLVDALRERRDEFDAVFFFTYLYYPTYAGLHAAPERSILVSTAHDEPPLRFGLYEEVFRLPRAFAFLTHAEEALVRQRFAVSDRPSVVAGMGVDVAEVTDEMRQAFRERHSIRKPYALYAGRIDAGKGCRQMTSFFESYLREKGDELELLLIGRLAMPLPQQAGIRYLGYLSEEEKSAAVAGASVAVCPSHYESLSIALLEAFAQSVPGLVNAGSAVLKDHCLRSNGGLYYENGDEFVEALDVLAAQPSLRRALGTGGRRYVGENYRWDVVLEKYRSLVDRVRTAR